MFDKNNQIEVKNIIYHIKEIKLLIVIHQQNKLWKWHLKKFFVSINFKINFPYFYLNYYIKKILIFIKNVFLVKIKKYIKNKNIYFK